MAAAVTAAAAHKKEDKADYDNKQSNIAAAANPATSGAANSHAVIEMKNFDEFKGYLLSGFAVVDCSATWCGPRKRLKPVFKGKFYYILILIFLYFY